ncbi:MAG: hypothetical protein ACRDHW_04070 [Ktedonobacteraceae bacterium]
MAQLATIRSAIIEDAQAIAELHIRSWQWAYSYCTHCLKEVQRAG